MFKYTWVRGPYIVHTRYVLKDYVLVIFLLRYGLNMITDDTYDTDDTDDNESILGISHDAYNIRHLLC